MNLEEKQLNKNYVYRGKIINVRCDTALLPNGSTAKREVVEHPGGVCVAAIDQNDNLLLVEQYRYPYFENVLEIPAGKRDKDGDSDPAVCGKRELLEETGMVAETFLPLGKFYPTPGYTNEVIYMFYAEKLTFKGQNLDEDEFLSVKKIPFEKAVKMVLNNEIADGKTQIAILKIKNLRENKNDC